MPGGEDDRGGTPSRGLSIYPTYIHVRFSLSRNDDITFASSEITHG